MRPLCWWMAACFWFTASMAWGWGLQVHMLPPVPRAGPVKMPVEWVREGFPAVVDIAQPRGERRRFARFEHGLLDRVIAGQLVLPRDFLMLKFLLTRVPGRNVDYDEFAYLARFFAGTVHEKEAVALLRPILRQPGLNPYFYCFAAHGLAIMNDKDSVVSMQVLLPIIRRDCVTSIRQSICQLGGVLPPEEAELPPQ